MSARKSERLVNLTICLLATRRYLSRDEIQAAVDGYQGLPEPNFERMFERDKDELRAMGIPIETGSNDHWFDDEIGYRIRRSDFELPPIDLTPAEATAVALAARVWQETALTSATQSALAKLQAAGADPDAARLGTLAPSMAPGGIGAGPAFDPLWSALNARRRVKFTYRGGEERHVEPWLLTFRRGAWYLTGRDLDRDGMRQFKLNRIVGVPVAAGKPDAYEIPPDIDARAVARRLEPQDPDAEALLAIRAGAAPSLRRRGTPLPDAAPLEGYELYRVRYAQSLDFAAEIAAAGPDAVALEPADLVRRVVAQLEAVAQGAA